MTSLLGESAGAVVTSVLALGIVLVLVVLGLWLVKLLSRSTNAVGRGRNRRLSVIDHMQVDARRQLLIVRRDNVEHLILTGGPADLVIESGIPVERPPAAAHRPPQHEVPPPQNPSLTRNEIDRLRQFVRGGAPRQGPSLRHTGLLRPVSTMEPAIIPMPPMAGDNSGRPGTDSATTPQGAENGRTAFGAQRNLGDTGTADTR
ncbi:MAG: flagellar biosynthetic protein FliO [Devosia sp.]|uniref:flagellar biosynthetic protein FliO n=1 Tax=Devosia sp. TaxID=1871048 RepID=UPI001ACADDCA|nr:flagellar biosynthetic protein FliO [Devosia sp.]MBN9310864.1 flagellar biosynthetic protein FliO [Devosia sp.]MBN9316055.1 flagellar biosynthetic protein FliO [Devosia sp.]